MYNIKARRVLDCDEGLWILLLSTIVSKHHWHLQLCRFATCGATKDIACHVCFSPHVCGRVLD